MVPNLPACRAGLGPQVFGMVIGRPQFIVYVVINSGAIKIYGCVWIGHIALSNDGPATAREGAK